MRSTWWSSSFRFACGCSRFIRSNKVFFRMSVIPVLVYASPRCHRSHISCFSASVISYHSLVPVSFPSASKKSPPLSSTVSGILPQRVTSAPERKWERSVCAKIWRSKNGSSPKRYTDPLSIGILECWECCLQRAPRAVHLFLDTRDCIGTEQLVLQIRYFLLYGRPSVD